MRAAEHLLMSADKVRDLLHYDPDTGVFIWKVGRQCTRGIGSVAGTVCNGYWSITINGLQWKAHRLAWLWMHGEFPPNGMQVDHINGARLDNRISNLRAVTQFGNMQNLRCVRRETRAGLLGVGPAGKKWAAQITTAGERQYLGTFSTPEQAHAAYLTAKRVQHETCTV